MAQWDGRTETQRYYGILGVCVLGDKHVRSVWLVGCDGDDDGDGGREGVFYADPRFVFALAPRVGGDGYLIGAHSSLFFLSALFGRDTSDLACNNTYYFLVIGMDGMERNRFISSVKQISNIIIVIVIAGG
jgi:hypothetical protein